MNRFSFLFIALWAMPMVANAQICTYLAYDGFNNPANTPLNGLQGGTGWAAPWTVQVEDMTLPGFQINNGAGSLSHNSLLTIGRFVRGGQAYLTAGRRFNTTPTGAFGSYVADNENGIGTEADGDTLWASYILRKDANNAQPVYMDLHNDGNIPWCNTCPSATQHIAVGYFGSTNSDVGGQRRWTVQINGNYYPMAAPVVVGTSVFVAIRLIFNAGNTNVAVYINPATGNTPPTTAAFSQNTGQANIIRSLAVYLGDNPNNGSMDELRMATRYPCVAPDNTVAVNMPPTAVIAATPTTGQSPLTVSFSGTASTDPEGQPLTYLWNFGDGTPTATGSTVSHTYTNILGTVNATLTVTDNLGLQHSISQAITVRNQYNTYPCQTSFSVLNMPSCNANNGRIRVNANGTTFALRNSANALMPTTNTNEYHNLAAGVYTFTSSGGANGCRDTFQLHLKRDSTTCTGWQANTCQMNIGTNLSLPIDWSPERPFKNLMKHSRPEGIPYVESCFCWYVPVLNEMTFDSEGYPTHLPQTTSQGAAVIRYILSSEGRNLRAGENYVILYDGSGTMQVNGSVTNVVIAPNRITFTCNGADNTFINILTSSAANRVRNIRVLRLADETANLTTHPFSEVFLNKIAPFRFLRFMDWGNTNGNSTVNWSDRSQVADRSYVDMGGVPYELMIKLANDTQKDVWLCLPHAANNDYITQVATLFRDNLNPNLNVYLEYSNEVWNWIFPQAHYNDQNRPSNLSYGRAYAEKAKNVFQLWHGVWGNQKHRVKRVLGMQVTYNGLNEQILSQLDQDDWDYGSPTHYFGLNHESSGNPALNASSTVANVMTNSTNYWLQNLPAFKTDYNQVHLFGKEVITYEGGQHFVGNSFGIPYDYQQAMWDAQYSPQMYAMYNNVLDTIRNWGCRLAGNFSLASPQESVYGSWGVLEHIDIQPPYMTTAPKYQALLDNIPNVPRPIIAGDNSICTAETQTYSVPAVAGSTYLWTVTGGTILSGQGTNIVQVRWDVAGTGTITIQQTAP